MKKENQEAVRLIDAYANTFGSRSGRIVLKDLQSYFFKTNSTFDPNPFKMALHEGARGVVIHIEQMIAQIKDKELMKQLLNPEEEEKE